jgi:hypothetical protein
MDFSDNYREKTNNTERCNDVKMYFFLSFFSSLLLIETSILNMFLKAKGEYDTTAESTTCYVIL